MRLTSPASSALLFTLYSGLSGCAVTVTPTDTAMRADGSLELVDGIPVAVCDATIRETGRRIAVEDEYLAGVVACENGNASFEALKAQAVAARSWLYVYLRTHSTVCNSQSCQVYSCGRPVREEHRRAVRETAGEVLMHEGTVTQSFYVAGVRRSGSTCGTILSSSSTERRTETYTTPGQEARRGDAVRIAPRPLSSGRRTPVNRGCMSQHGANCLASNAGYDYRRILRYYYGGDIERVRAVGACVDEPIPERGCQHSIGGGTYPDGGCTASYACDGGRWRLRASDESCACEESTGAGCSATEPEAPIEPTPIESGTGCLHTYGGTFESGGCTAGYYCQGDSWRRRRAEDSCACVEQTGRIGCVAAVAPSEPTEPAGASCDHTYGGVYADLACSTSYQCVDGAWRRRSDVSAACRCVETSGRYGCGL